MKIGTIRFTAPATSGLCFRASLLGRMLPMPEEIVITSDNYLKAASLGLAPGFVLNERLAIQLIHFSNAYTNRNGFEERNASIAIKTAAALKSRFPSLSRVANNCFTAAISSLNTIPQPELAEHIQNYRSRLSVIDRAESALRIAMKKVVSGGGSLGEGI